MKQGRTGIELQELIRHAQSGDEAAFEELIDQFYAPVFGLLCKWTGHWQDAEDLTQETFLKAYKYLKSFHQGQSFKNWIYKIALNLANNRYAATRRQPQTVELDEAVLEHVVAPENATEKVRQRQILSRVYGLLPRLTERERSVFVLKIMEGMENADIARVLGIAETTVRRFYGLARRKIVDEIEQADEKRGSS